MIWNIVIILAIVALLVILARRIPDARKMMTKAEVSSGEISLYGLVAQADEAFENKRYKEAEELYVKAALADPDNPKIYSRLGAIYLEEKNFYDARDAFLHAVKLEPDIASRYINLGLAFMGLKDYFKATEEFRKALEFDKKNHKYKKLLERSEKFYEREKRGRK